MNELKAALEQSGDAKSMFSFAPGIEKSLEDFREKAEKYAQTSGIGFVNFARVGIQAKMLAGSLTGELQQIMHAKPKEGNFTAAHSRNMEVSFSEHSEKITAYLDAVQRALSCVRGACLLIPG